MYKDIESFEFSLNYRNSKQKKIHRTILVQKGPLVEWNISQIPTRIVAFDYIKYKPWWNPCHFKCPTSETINSVTHIPWRVPYIWNNRFRHTFSAWRDDTLHQTRSGISNYEKLRKEHYKIHRKYFQSVNYIQKSQ